MPGDAGHAPRRANMNAEDVLKELGIARRSTDYQKGVVAREAWRLSPEEIGWLHDAGLTDLTVEVAELMAKGWAEAAAREAVAVRHGDLGGTSGKE